MADGAANVRSLFSGHPYPVPLHRIPVNMGSFCRVIASQAVELARALRGALDVLDRQPGTTSTQVLWKLKMAENRSPQETEMLVHGMLRGYIQADRVRIVEWVQAEPASILASGHVVCAVHHGGANSYHEAVV